MRKKVIGILIVLFMVSFSLGVYVKAKENPTRTPGLITYKLTLQIGNREFDINNAGYIMDVSPYIKYKRTMVPLSLIDTAFGYSVTVNSDKTEVTIEANKTKIIMKIGSQIVSLRNNGRQETWTMYIDAPLEIKQEIIFLPIRFISEKTGLRVTWYEKERKVIIDNKEEI